MDGAAALNLLTLLPPFTIQLSSGHSASSLESSKPPVQPVCLRVLLADEAKGGDGAKSACDLCLL
jgi:hypothetical protein